VMKIHQHIIAQRLVRAGSILLFLFVLVGCRSSARLASNEFSGEELTMHLPGAPVVIYKTNGDYRHLVPVMMNEARTEILSYPDPADVWFEGRLAVPSLLNKGYLLDNRGINEHVVFLSYTYEEYSRMEQAPTLEQMMQHIRERYPLVEMYRCGLRSEYRNLIEEVNVLIDRSFSNCEKSPLMPMQMVL